MENSTYLWCVCVDCVPLARSLIDGPFLFSSSRGLLLLFFLLVGDEPLPQDGPCPFTLLSRPCFCALFSLPFLSIYLRLVPCVASSVFRRGGWARSFSVSSSFLSRFALDTRTARPPCASSGGKRVHRTVLLHVCA